MTEFAGVILAAGRGSRMKGLTDQKPKCLLELAGKSLLEWQLDSLGKAGITRILVVTGYKGDMLVGDFESVTNPRWESTNMVQTLLCAFSKSANYTLIVSYGDIVYRPDHVRALMTSKEDFAITYDVNWQALWALRNEDPLEDAETFMAKEGKVVDIGRKPQSLDEVQGQYMGLLRFTPAGQRIVQDYVHGLPTMEADKLDMTSLLRALLSLNYSIGAIPVQGGWCECDTSKDIDLYQDRLTKNDWGHDWRE